MGVVLKERTVEPRMQKKAETTAPTYTGISLEDYIYIEAKEKCYEVEIKALKEFQKAKEAIVDRESATIRDSFDGRYRAREVEHRIQRSTRINLARLKKMNERNRAVLRILHHAQFELLERITKDREFYSGVLRKLILQGLIRMMEKQVMVRCLPRDVSLVNEIIPSVRQTFHDLVQKELGQRDFWVEIKVDESSPLEPREIVSLDDDADIEAHNEEITLHKEEDHKKCFGGVVITSGDGATICKNTLDIRMEQCFQESLPVIRKTLFPEGR
eukprot:TRINITY_DN4125_c0_g1_i1.p1 TRINITY_DN4125_c0_g1~~TRINITY_DN4125_c0_g1_i1.p1  ORF type:complete len:272 (-),score=70.90 TRINITY_DN4125_c0_g1_i1:892-1707(-)